MKFFLRLAAALTLSTCTQYCTTKPTVDNTPPILYGGTKTTSTPNRTAFVRAAFFSGTGGWYVKMNSAIAKTKVINACSAHEPHEVLELELALVAGN